mmetsp:Transcript_16914/g.42702  ORF Transcript_16914/g.42702 Transcript_16914/m.42702 type:complete len:421 (-) Transcript_16914:67-1329(-)
MGRTRGNAAVSKAPEKKGSKVSRSNKKSKQSSMPTQGPTVVVSASKQPPPLATDDEALGVDHDPHWAPGSHRGGSKGHPFSNAAAAWLKAGKVLNTDLLKQTRWPDAIGEVKCEAFELERKNAEGKGKAVRIVIVPGNPGVCAYYVRTAKMLYERLGGQVSVSAVSMLGFPTDAADARLVSLPEEAVHLASLLHAMHERHPEEEFVLVGHSIGAWMCTEAMKGYPDLPVAACAMVFPFVSVGRDKMRRQNWLDTRSWPWVLRPLVTTAMATMGQMGMVLSLFSSWQQRLLLKVLGSEAEKDQLCREVTLEYFGSKPHILKSVFFLGKTEMCLLPRPSAKYSTFCDVEMSSLLGIQEKLHWLYTTDDHWAPLSQATDVRFSLPASSVEVIEDLGHAFCMKEEHDAKVADWVCGLPCLSGGR